MPEAVSVSTVRCRCSAVGSDSGARASAGVKLTIATVSRVTKEASRITQSFYVTTASRHAYDPPRGDARELLRSHAEHRVGMAARRPHLRPRHEVFVDERGDHARVTDGRHAADGEARV